MESNAYVYRTNISPIRTITYKKKILQHNKLRKYQNQPKPVETQTNNTQQDKVNIFFQDKN